MWARLVGEIQMTSLNWLSAFSFLTLFSPSVAFLPLRLSVQTWLLFAVTGVTGLILQPDLQFEDRGMFDGLVAATFLTFLGVSLLITLIRFATAGDDPDQGNLVRYAIDWSNRIVALVTGACAGLFASLGLALLLRGMSNGLAVHLGLLAVAAGLLLVVVRLSRGVIRLAGCALLSVLAGAAILGGSMSPHWVIQRANLYAEDAPYCLRSGTNVARLDETMWLTLPRGVQGSPGLILTVMAPEGPKHYRWSYRATDFMSYGSYRHGPCPS